MKTREEILALQQAAVDANKTETLNDRLIDLFAALAEYPEPGSGVKAEIASFFNTPSDQPTPEISDEAFPVFVVRDLLSVKRVTFNPALLAPHWDTFAERYEDAILTA